MIKEEEELRNWISDNSGFDNERLGKKLLRALVRAVREDCAKIYLKQECEEPDPYKIAAAIRGRK